MSNESTSGKADFHCHSVLSPCADLSVSPKAIVERAVNLGLQVQALTDHNSGENLRVFEKLCADNGITPVCGIEATTVEEVHILCFFPDAPTAEDFGRHLFDFLPRVPNRVDIFGDQLIVNEADEITGEIDFFLTNALKLEIGQVVEAADKWGGIIVPAHINRPAFSLNSQLGYIPSLPFSALEIVAGYRDTAWKGPLITGSDTHSISQTLKGYSVYDTNKVISGSTEDSTPSSWSQAGVLEGIKTSLFRPIIPADPVFCT